MKITLAGPLVPGAFQNYLDDEAAAKAQVIPGLGGTPVNLLGRALLDRGHWLTLITLDRSVTEEVTLRGRRLTICIGPYRKSHRARNFFAPEREYVRRTIEREAPEFVHAHWTYEFALGALAAGRPTLITAHDAPLRILRMTPDFYRVVRTIMAWKVLRRARHLAAVSPYVSDHLRRVFRCRQDISIIPNGFPQSLFDLGGNRAAHSEGAPTFATVLPGWSTLKNGAAAIRAFEKFRRLHIRARLLMFGQDYGPGQVAVSWAAKRGISVDGIDFVGAVAHDALLQRLADEIDVLIHPSLEEAHPMAVCEAMALGIPVIGGASSGGVPWTLENGAAGVLVDVRDPSALSAAMADLIGDPSRRRRLGQAGRDSARRRFHMDVIASRYEKAYAAICAPGHCHVGETPRSNILVGERGV